MYNKVSSIQFLPNANSGLYPVMLTKSNEALHKNRCLFPLTEQLRLLSSQCFFPKCTLHKYTNADASSYTSCVAFSLLPQGEL